MGDTYMLNMNERGETRTTKMTDNKKTLTQTDINLQIESLNLMATKLEEEKQEIDSKIKGIETLKNKLVNGE